jgi:hypothetical protein
MSSRITHHASRHYPLLLFIITIALLFDCRLRRLGCPKKQTTSVMWRTWVIFLLTAFVGVQCFQRIQQQQQHAVEHQVTTLTQGVDSLRSAASRTRQDFAEMLRPVPLLWESIARSKRDCPCPLEDGGNSLEEDDDDEDALSDIGEAAFSIIGSLWASGALPTAVIFPDVINDDDSHDIWTAASLEDTLGKNKIQMALQLVGNHPNGDEQMTEAISKFLTQAANVDSSILSHEL